MKKYFLLVLSIMFLLTACGQKYEKEIEQVSKLEKKSVEETKNSDYREFKRETSNFYVYEDGKVIIVKYKPYKDSAMKSNRFYRLNETTDKYEKDTSVHKKKYMKDHKPDYKEENMKK